MTGGGPGGSTETLSLYAYQSWFRYLDFGYGAAIAVQGMLVALLLAALVVRVASRREEA
jgi:carbohydrate ABC transporter membrane protein 1, CUT1 family (TC 3.A.1.1.-)